MSLRERQPPTPDEYRDYRRRFNNWGRWEQGDPFGTLNHITPSVREAAARLVREGLAVGCANPVATSTVLGPRRNPRPAEHRLESDAGGCSDFIGVSYHGFANTHIDALCHIFTPDGLLYGGHSRSAVTAAGAAHDSIDRWRNGIVTRGVLYDVPRFRERAFVTEDAPVHGWELEDIALAQEVRPQPGDAVLVRTGADAFWAANPDFGPPWQAPGLHASALEFLFETRAALLGWDLMEAPGQDEYEAPSLPIHSIAIPYMGLPLLDNATFERLAVECARAGRYEFFFTIAPLVILGGTGSPVNPIAVL